MFTVQNLEVQENLLQPVAPAPEQNNEDFGIEDVNAGAMEAINLLTNLSSPVQTFPDFDIDEFLC